jgi:hypothetical protein
MAMPETPALNARYIPQPGARRRAVPPGDLLFTLPFIALFLVQLAHHNLWRDELNAFGIVLASPTPSSLFRHIHYEGHPWLWYAVLWVVSRFTASPLSMKIVEAFIGTAIYFLIGIGSPFSRGEKLLLFLCYFISFEYTVLSRMYSLVLLFLLIYLRSRVLHPERFIRNAVILGLIASADLMGLMLSVALLLEYVVATGASPELRLTTARKRIVYGVLVYVGLAALSIWSMKPAPDISWRTTGHLFRYAKDGQHFLDTLYKYVVLPYFPIRLPTSGYFWNPIAGKFRIIFLALVPLVLASYFLIFRGYRSLLVLLGSTLIMSVAFGQLIYDGFMRHFGVTFLAFFAACWLLRARLPRLPRLAYALLGLTAIAGIMAGADAWRRPFSNAEPAANWLRANHLDAAFIAGTPDTSLAGIAELLRRPVYMLDCNCSDSFNLFSNRRDQFEISQIPDRLLLASNSLNGSSFLFMGVVPLSTDQQSEINRRGLLAMPLTSFTGAEADQQENFYIYRISSLNVAR